MIDPSPASAASQPRAMARARFLRWRGQRPTVTRARHRTNKQTRIYKIRLIKDVRAQTGLCHDRERLNRYPLAGAAHFRHRSGSSAPLRTTSIFPWRQASLEESRCRSFTRTSAFGAAYGSSSITVAPSTCGTPEKRIANLDMNDSEHSMPLLGIQEPLRDRSIRVDPAVAEERPVAAGFLLKLRVAIGDEDLLGVLAGLGV